MVVQIMTKEKRSHLVAIIKGMLTLLFIVFNTQVLPVPEEEDNGDSDSEQSPWYLFNDFRVRRISEHEALSFPAEWKVR